MTVIKTLETFLEDKKAWEMFITGRAGTGKTTTLKKVVQYLIDNNIDYIVCAFTHKACSVLESKLPKNANITTLHSYLRKRPSINEHATKTDHIDTRLRMGESERPPVVLIDEFSMVGELDYVDLIAMQDPHDEMAKSTIKVVYVGDPYQLPPVGDLQTIKPKKPYWVELEKVHRTDRIDLLNAMTDIVEMINGRDLEPIRSSKNIIRGKDIVKEYKSSNSKDKIILAWTNKTVQTYNFKLAGKESPDPGDSLWNSTLRHELTFEYSIPNKEINSIDTVHGELNLNTKYKTLEFLKTQDYVSFFKVYNSTIAYEQVLAVCFGTYNFKLLEKSLKEQAVEINKEIESKFKESPAIWARKNYNHKLAIKRAKIWRALLTFKDCVCCVDFPYAMTIHKSQGSTYEEVYMDTDDLALCGNTNVNLYLRLFYVGLSRTSKRLITN